MKLQFSMFSFQLTVEVLWLGPELVLRRYRIVPGDAAVRRKLLRNVRRRLHA